MCPECRVSMWHQQTSQTPALACLVATEGGSVAETHFLCNWEEALLFFHWLCRESLRSLTPAACVLKAQEAALWSLCFSV